MQLGLNTRVTRSSGDPPALALDFRQSQLDGRLSFSRASTGTDVVAGVLTSYGVDAPRLSPANGLLLEEARTNSLRNSLGSGAVAGVVGSGGSLPTNWGMGQQAALSTEVVGTGTRNGFSYVRLRISGTPDGSVYAVIFEGVTQVVAAQAEVWCASFYAMLAAGSLSNVAAVNIRLDERSSAGSTLATSRAALAGLNSAAFVRAQVVRTLTNAATARLTASVDLTLTAGQAIDVTLDIAAPQLELGAFATSFVPTSGAAATRAADLCSMGATSWANNSEGTIWAEAVSGDGINTAASISPRVLQLETAGGSNDSHSLRRNAADSRAQARSITGGANLSILTTNVWDNLTTLRMAYAYRHNDMAFIATGGTLQTDSSSPEGMPTPLSVLRLGAAAGSSGFFNGWLRGVRYWPRRLSNEQIRAVTQ